MKTKAKTHWLLITAGMVIIASLGIVSNLRAQGEQVTLVGEINDTAQLVANGNIYDIAETAEGDDLVKNYISVKVRVTGSLHKGAEIDVITVRTFEVVDE